MEFEVEEVSGATISSFSFSLPLPLGTQVDVVDVLVVSMLNFFETWGSDEHNELTMAGRRVYDS